MPRVIVNDKLRDMLYDLTRPLVLCDESGKILGHIFPVTDTPTIVTEGRPMNQEELRSRKQPEEQS